MNNTPRTDKEAVIVNGMARAHLCEVWKEAVNADFARELERENAKLRAAIVGQPHDGKPCDVLLAEESQRNRESAHMWAKRAHELKNALFGVNEAIAQLESARRKIQRLCANGAGEPRRWL